MSRYDSKNAKWVYFETSTQDVICDVSKTYNIAELYNALCMNADVEVGSVITLETEKGVYARVMISEWEDNEATTIRCFNTETYEHFSITYHYG